jgi:hypothetical protein
MQAFTCCCCAYPDINTHTHAADALITRTHKKSHSLSMEAFMCCCCAYADISRHKHTHTCRWRTQRYANHTHTHTHTKSHSLSMEAFMCCCCAYADDAGLSFISSIVDVEYAVADAGLSPHIRISGIKCCDNCG